MSSRCECGRKIYGYIHKKCNQCRMRKHKRLGIMAINKQATIRLRELGLSGSFIHGV
jgi:hypothetical protein